MEKILIATRNHGKFAELKGVFTHGVSLEEAGLDLDVAETGKTFEENALLKAKAYSNASGLTTVADDGGMEIPALGNAPGVLSRRWPGHEATDRELVDYSLKQMRGLKGRQREARLVTVVGFHTAKGESAVFREEIHGRVTEAPCSVHAEKIPKGYPFRTIFFLPQLGKHYCELSEKEHDSLNHRKKAALKARHGLESLLTGNAPAPQATRPVTGFY